MNQWERTAKATLFMDSTRTWFWPGVVLCFFSFPSLLYPYSIYLYDRVSVGSGVVRIKDLGRVEGERESGIVSSRIVVSGLKRPVYLTSDRLRAQLSGVGERPDGIYGNGVWVLPMTEKLTRGDLETMLRNSIQSREGGAAYLQKTILKLESPAEISTTPDGAVWEFRLPARVESLKPGKTVMAMDLTGVDPSGKKTILKREMVTFQISQRIAVTVATRNIRIGERLSASDWRREERTIDNGDTVGMTVEDPSGMRAMVSIQSGEILNPRSVQTMPAIRRGQTVELVYQRPGIVIRARSVAERQGNVGDTIPVRVLFPSGKLSDDIKARIVDDGIAVMEENQRNGM